MPKIKQWEEDKDNASSLVPSNGVAWESKVNGRHSLKTQLK
jgi:hypothetical protein